jgi:hypothetical protein
MFMLTRVSSAMPTTETSEEAFNKRMNSLISGGIEMRSACGSRMRRQTSRPEKPSATAASAWPGGVAASAPRRQRQPADRRGEGRHVEAELGEEIIDEQQQHQQRHAAKEADVDAAEPRQPDAARQLGDANRRADDEAERDAGERNRQRRPRRLGQIAEGMKDDLRVHRAPGKGGARAAPPAKGQIEGWGTVLGRSIVWPNHFFWIVAIVPSPSTLTIAALTASTRVASSSRPTQEK